MCAGEEYVVIVLVDIDDIHVLVWVVLVQVLVVFVDGVVLVLQDEAVGVPAVEGVVE
jgi:hypothetical protein